MIVDKSLMQIIKNKYKDIDQYRPKLPFFLFFLTLDIVFSFSTMATSSYPFIFAFVLTPELDHTAPMMYDMIQFGVKILTFITPFILTFFLLDTALSGMLSIQRLEQKLIQRILDWKFKRDFKKNRSDTNIPRWFEKLGSSMLGMNRWFEKRPKWQQYFIILSMFTFYNPYIMSLVLIFY